MKVFVRDQLAQHEAGVLTDKQVVENLRGEMGAEGPVSRVEYVRGHYSFDNMVTGGIFNKNTGTMLNSANIHGGPGESPIPRARAIWFLVVGDDPAQVRIDSNGRIYALYEGGEGRVSIKDAAPKGSKHLVPADHIRV